MCDLTDTEIEARMAQIAAKVFDEKMAAHIDRSNKAGLQMLADLPQRRAKARAVPTTDGSPRNVLAGGGPLDHAATAKAGSTKVRSGNAANISGGAE